MKTKKSQNIQIGFLLLPGILIFGFFTIYPIVKLFITSFFKWDFGSMLIRSSSDLPIIKGINRFIFSPGIFEFHCVGNSTSTNDTWTSDRKLINNINKFSISFEWHITFPLLLHG